MSKQFFITGLPRSRTAWFSNLFTWGDSICYHDALCPDINSVYGTDSLRQLQAKLHKGVRGHSCSSNLLVWRTLNKWFPDAKWVFIYRHQDEVAKSCEQFIGPCREALSAWLALENEAIRVVDYMGVDFHDIDAVACYAASEFLGVPIGPEARVRQLLDMNIQIHPPVLKERLRALNVSTIVDTKEAA